ncbi:hypothetical protein [Xanthomonas fragariae]|uniref:hypothetical protein n=1 Tax=Xanthomonas fragariae TaxID=48664 RepID=UPI003D18CA9A
MALHPTADASADEVASTNHSAAKRVQLHNADVELQCHTGVWRARAVFLSLAPPPHPQRGPLEVYALYRQLAPGSQMQAQWNLLRYTGSDAGQVQQQFLCSKAKELQLTNVCVASSAAP